MTVGALDFGGTSSPAKPSVQLLEHLWPDGVAWERRMRLYVKLMLMIVLFVCVSQGRVRLGIASCAYDIHVAYVCNFGSETDFEQLVDEMQYALARRLVKAGGYGSQSPVI